MFTCSFSHNLLLKFTFSRSHHVCTYIHAHTHIHTQTSVTHSSDRRIRVWISTKKLSSRVPKKWFSNCCCAVLLPSASNAARHASYPTQGWAFETRQDELLTTSQTTVSFLLASILMSGKTSPASARASWNGFGSRPHLISLWIVARNIWSARLSTSCCLARSWPLSPAWYDEDWHRVRY